jgi:hypothetical protein
VAFGPDREWFIERFGKRGLMRWELWATAAANVVAAFLWFTHAHSLYEATGLTFGLSDKLFSGELLLSLQYPWKIGTRLLKDLLGPVGLFFGAYGLVTAVRRRYWVEPLGVAAFVTYLAVVTVGNYHHNYYQLPIVPVAAVLAALGITDAVRRMGDARRWSDDRRVCAFAAILGVAATSAFVRSVSFHSWYEVDQSRVCICGQLAPLLERTDRIVFANYQSPDILFCLHRKGWLLSTQETTPERLVELSAQGADVVVVQRADDGIARVVEETLAGEMLTSTPAFTAYRLRRRQ